MIACLCNFRDESRHLPGFLAHLRDWVDVFIGCDDGSVDDSAALFSREPKCGGLHRAARSDRPFLNQVENKLILLRQARAMGADWVLYADADTRVDLRFLPEMARLARPGFRARYCLRLRDLWDSRERYRIDGRWGKKWSRSLFSLSEFRGYWPAGTVHAHTHPPRHRGRKIKLDFNLYHLGSLTREDRLARVEAHKRADPDNAFQRIGYDYLADEKGLKLEAVPPGSLWPD